eukprot:9329751-Pyramimonas_sp.AAC.1
MPLGAPLHLRARRHPSWTAHPVQDHLQADGCGPMGRWSTRSVVASCTRELASTSLMWLRSSRSK